MSDYWLFMLLAVPLIGAIVTIILQPESARKWALFVSIATFLISAVIASHLGEALLRGDGKLPDFHGAEIAGVGASFHLGVDAISMWLVLLTTFLTPLAIAASFTAITERTREYYAWMLALLAVMLGVFIAKDLLLFYVFFELTLVPMFFIIGIWGGPERRYAAGKFFLFTFAGGVFTLAATIYLGAKAGNFDIATVVHVAQTQIGPNARYWLVLGLLAGFAVKIPLFPVHTWLPLAHTEAPTAGSVILAGVLLKLGTYGLLRLAIPIGLVSDGGGASPFPALIHFLGALCIIGIIYGALVAWVQQDIKKLVAYSSVSHLGFCILGLLALNDIGMQGSVLYMINHGISTGAMFLVIGMVYERFHTRDISRLSGLAKKMPIFAFFFIFFTLASIGLPGLNGFWSEFLTIQGAFISDHLGIGYGACAALGVILGAVYMLHMAARVIFGPLKFPGDPADHAHKADDHAAASSHGVSGDLNGREIGILVPLAIAVVVLGVYPNLIVSPIRGPLERIMNTHRMSVHKENPAEVVYAPSQNNFEESK